MIGLDPSPVAASQDVADAQRRLGRAEVARAFDLLPPIDPATVASLVAQRKVKRMLRTKAQREADRLGADVDALTAALVALGVEPSEDGAA